MFRYRCKLICPSGAIFGGQLARKVPRDAKIACAQILILQAASRWLARSRWARRNIPLSFFRRLRLTALIPLPTRGALRVVTNVVRNAVDGEVP